MTTERFGWRTADLDAVAHLLERALNIQFEPREGLYHGGNYWSWPAFEQRESHKGRLTLQSNFFDEFDQELAYPEYGDQAVLLLAQDLPDGWAEHIEAVEGAEVLEN